MSNVVVYGTTLCPYCQMAKRLLGQKNVEFTDILVDRVEGARQEMVAKSDGRHSVPQIFINDTHIGGFTDMLALDKQGKLDSLLFE